MKSSIARGLTILGLVVALASCGGNEVLAPTVSVSVGQQLIDLKKARDSGAMTERDYQKQKEQVIDSVK